MGNYFVSSAKIYAVNHCGFMVKTQSRVYFTDDCLVIIENLILDYII